MNNNSKKYRIPLFEGDPSDSAVLNPQDWLSTVRKLRGITHPDLPKYGILSFQYMRLSETLEKKYNGKKIIFFENYPPLYKISFKSLKIVCAFIPVGSAAAGMRFEELIACGLTHAILVGGAGVLDPQIQRGTLIIPMKALRDEGTSFHYQTPSRYARSSEKVSQSLRKTLLETRKNFLEGTTWTTDAPYRETYGKIRQYRAEGIVSVDMEASALFSIARFRKIDLGALFVAGDCIGGENWDDRRQKGDQNQVNKFWEKALDLAINALWKLHNYKETLQKE
ncbi:MAG: nucleoside phosphorylase [Promethearchaeota archaeon]